MARPIKCSKLHVVELLYINYLSDVIDLTKDFLVDLTNQSATCKYMCFTLREIKLMKSVEMHVVTIIPKIF